MPQVQVPNSQTSQLQQMQQMQQMQTQMYGRDSYGQRPMTPSQYTDGHVLPWQIQGMQSSMHGGSGVCDSGQFFSSPGQNLPRTASVSQTLMQGNTGECPQMHFIDRNAPNSVVLQVNPQNKFFRNVDM
jgi:hypothetical protein